MHQSKGVLRKSFLCLSSCFRLWMSWKSDWSVLEFKFIFHSQILHSIESPSKNDKDDSLNPKGIYFNKLFPLAFLRIGPHTRFYLLFLFWITIPLQSLLTQMNLLLLLLRVSFCFSFFLEYLTSPLYHNDLIHWNDREIQSLQEVLFQWSSTWTSLSATNAPPSDSPAIKV